MSRLSPLVLVALIGVGTAGGCDDDPSADTGPFGSLLDVDEYLDSARALPAEVLTEGLLPLSVPSVILSNTPAVAKQGTARSPGAPGTCEAQAFGYGLGTYTAARAADGSPKWDAADPQNTVSAAYQFALALNDGFAMCSGGKATPYLSRLAGFGSPTEAEVPYEPDCDYFSTIDLNVSYPDEGRLRIGSFATFMIESSTEAERASVLARIKAYLANGQAVAFSGQVYKDYVAPTLTDGVFYDEASNLTDDGHGQLLVGFDDTIGTATDPGALLVQNSFGVEWPAADAGSVAPPGKLFWSYRTFLVSQKLFAVAYPFDSSPPTGTMLSADESNAPVAAVTRAFQYASDDNPADAFLVLLVHFAEPVRILLTAMAEPAPGAETAVGQYGQFISNGYVYLRRTDGNQFLAGDYDVTLDTELLDGTRVSYTTTVTVGEASPGTPPAASMKVAPDRVVDTTGKPVVLVQ